MHEAVEKAFGAAVDGEVVLLSPACASFDMFEQLCPAGQPVPGNRRKAGMTSTAKRSGIQPLVYDLGLLFPVLLLVGMGIVMVYSASSALAVKKFGSGYFF